MDLRRLIILICGVCATIATSRGAPNRQDAMGSPGSIDPSFGLALVIDGGIKQVCGFGSGYLLVGDFASVSGVARPGIARINLAGELDTAFADALTIRGLDSRRTYLNHALIASESRILITGQFSAVDGFWRGSFAALNALGQLDGSFLSGEVGLESFQVGTSHAYGSSIAKGPGGRVLVSGVFTHANQERRSGIASYDREGHLDGWLAEFPGIWSASFTYGANSTIVSLRDRSMLVGGAFSSLGGYPRVGLGRVTSDGLSDPTFPDISPGEGAQVSAICETMDGEVIVGGAFSEIGGRSVANLARIARDGSVDSKFTPTIVGPRYPLRPKIMAIVVQPDGKIIVGGSFTNVNGVHRNRIARLHADGTLDENFGAGLNGANGEVHTLLLQPDGRLVVGGYFNAFNEVNCFGLVRLFAMPPSYPRLSVVDTSELGLGLSVHGLPATRYVIQIKDSVSDEASWRVSQAVICDSAGSGAAWISWGPAQGSRGIVRASWP